MIPAILTRSFIQSTNLVMSGVEDLSSVRQDLLFAVVTANKA